MSRKLTVSNTRQSIFWGFFVGGGYCGYNGTIRQIDPLGVNDAILHQ